MRISFPLVIAGVSVLFNAHSAAAAQDLGTVDHLSLARAALQANHPDQAEPEYEAVLQTYPGNVEAHANLGVLLYFRHNCPAARPHLDAALEHQPAAGQIRAVLALCEAQDGNVAEAEAELRAALPNVENARVRELVLTQLTQLAYTRGDLEQAGTDVAALIKAEPDAQDTLYLAYRVYGDLADAARNRLTTIAPDSARTHQLTAQRFINTGNAEMAIRQYREALARDPKLPGLHFEIGEALLQESASEDARSRARAEFVLALQDDPHSSGAEAKLGIIESIAGNSGDAETHFRRALDLNADELDALEGLAELEHRRGDESAALAHLQRAVRIDASNDRLHLRMAQIYRVKGDRASADRETALFKQLRELKSKTDLTDLQRSKATPGEPR